MRKRGEQSRHSENGKRGDRGVAGRGGADGTGVNIDKAKKTTQTGTRGRARRRVDQSEEMVWTSTIRRVIIRHECHARQREGKQYEVSCINRDERRKEMSFTPLGQSGVYGDLPDLICTGIYCDNASIVAWRGRGSRTNTSGRVL